MSDAMIAHFNAMPVWMYGVWAIGVWAIGVWGAVLGSLLLLLRSRWSVQLFALSLIGAAISLIYQAVINPPPPPLAAVQAYMPYGIVVIAVLLLWYAWAMAKRGVLR